MYYFSQISNSKVYIEMIFLKSKCPFWAYLQFTINFDYAARFNWQFLKEKSAILQGFTPPLMKKENQIPTRSATFEAAIFKVLLYYVLIAK